MVVINGRQGVLRNNMKILCIYQFFSTGKTPESKRPYRFCRLLAEKGNEVVVISTDFSRHSGESEGPKKELIPMRNGSITVLRVPSVRKYRKGLFYRFIHYAGFSIRALIKGFQISDIDIVLTSIPPIFVGPIGWFIAAVRRKPFILEVRDLWPDALEVKGAVKNPFLLRGLYAMANFLYRKACFIVSITFGIQEELEKKGIDHRSIAVLPNGMDPELFKDVPDRNTTRQQLGWENDFVVIYIGTLVEVTSMDTVVEAATYLRDIPGIRFEIYGSGNTENELKKMISDKKLTNCHLNGTVSKNRVPALLNAADACVMCLFETPLAHIYLQNKFFDYLGAGKPIVAALRGHQREILEQIEAGICADPEDSKGLADAIRKLFNDPDASHEMGRRGKAFAGKHFCLDDILNTYVDLINTYATGKTSTVKSHSNLTLSSYFDHNVL
jgi:glycosyltransferase involved in cell wall biosynthesis